LPPKVDKYVSEFLGKKFPRDHDNELVKIQATVLACIRPLTTAWQELIEDGLDTEPELMVPARTVLEIIQRSLCLIGSAAEGISQDRRTKILEAIDQSWGKLGAEVCGKTDSLFGKEFQSSLIEKVESNTALARAVSLQKQSLRDKEQSSSTKKEGQTYTRFFRGGPPAMYGGSQGKTPFPYWGPPQPRTHPRGGEASRGGSRYRSHRFHEPRLPLGESNKPTPRKF
jgi:hypothetical protein